VISQMQKLNAIRREEAVGRQQLVASQQKLQEAMALYTQKKFADSIPLFQEALNAQPDFARRGEYLKLAQAEDSEGAGGEARGETAAGDDRVAPRRGRRPPRRRRPHRPRRRPSPPRPRTTRPRSSRRRSNHSFTDGQIIVKLGADTVVHAQLWEETGRAMFRRKRAKPVNVTSEVAPKNADLQIWVIVPAQKITQYRRDPRGEGRPGQLAPPQHQLQPAEQDLLVRAELSARPTFAIATRDELRLRGHLVEERLSHGVSTHSANGIDATDERRRRAGRALRRGALAAAGRRPDRCARAPRGERAASRGRDDDHRDDDDRPRRPLVVTDADHAANDAQLLDLFNASPSFALFSAPPALAPRLRLRPAARGRRPIPRSTATQPLDWPSWLSVRDEPPFAVDDLGNETRATNLLAEAPACFRRESFRDVPLRRMSHCIARQHGATVRAARAAHRGSSRVRRRVRATRRDGDSLRRRRGARRRRRAYAARCRSRSARRARPSHARSPARAENRSAIPA
jgi:hypothetical protein